MRSVVLTYMIKFQALLEVVQSRCKNLEICVMEANAKSRMLTF